MLAAPARSILAHLGLVLAVLTACASVPVSAAGSPSCGAAVDAEPSPCCSVPAQPPRCCCDTHGSGEDTGLESGCDCRLSGTDAPAVLLLPPPPGERPLLDGPAASTPLAVDPDRVAPRPGPRAPIEARVRPGPNLILLHRVYRI